MGNGRRVRVEPTPATLWNPSMPPLEPFPCRPWSPPPNRMLFGDLMGVGRPAALTFFLTAHARLAAPAALYCSVASRVEVTLRLLALACLGARFSCAGSNVDYI